MTREIQFGNGPDGKDELEPRKTDETLERDAELVQALTAFRASVHAWSAAAYHRPKRFERTVRQRSWRLAAGWALGCVLVAGGVTAGVVEHQLNEQAARMASQAQQQAREQQQVAAKEQAREQDTGLMAKVDSDTSQEVPDAMEPLARMMEDGGTE